MIDSRHDRRFRISQCARASRGAESGFSVIALTRDGERTVLVLEDPGGEPLERFLGKPMELGRFLQLAISLAAGLSKLHGQGLIHKDIKPANILVDSVTCKVWFTGFGISSRLVRERPLCEGLRGRSEVQPACRL